jgi:phosphoadenosine phosphosulfate reductase
VSSPPATRRSPLERPGPFDDDRTAANGNGHGRLPMIGGEPVDPEAVAAEVERLTASEAIAWAIERFHPDLRFAISFQKTSSVIIDVAHAIEPEANFFYLDTDLLFDQTYAARDALANRYEIEFDRFSGMSLRMQENVHGASLWRRHPDACCGIRKVEPMQAALSEAECWVSGIRRVDSESRAGAAKFGWDKRFGMWKLNPLADWTDEQIWNHIRENEVPYNELHDQGYTSVGCTHCTVRPGADNDTRSGRWVGLDKNECGING